MPDKTARGRFVWHELLVPDTAKAHAFYEKVVGWKTQPFEPNPSYQMFAASSGPLAGSVPNADGPPHWLPYIGSTDFDATLQLAQDLGATVDVPPQEIPNGGRWARLKDPQGAPFGIYWFAEKPGREKPPKRGEFSWHELATTDYKAAFDFYSQLFGWENAGEHDMGPEFGMYFMFSRNGVPLGGMFNLMPGMPSSAWTGYVRVKDVNKSVKKVKSAGGTLINGPMEVPGGDWIAQFLDPQGAAFAVHVLQADLAPPAAPSAPGAPAQGSLDFPPPSGGEPEKVAVVAKAPAGKPDKVQSTKPQAKPAAKAKKPPAKKVAAKPSPKKKAGKKTVVARKTARKPAKKVSKPNRKAPAKKQAGSKKPKKKALKKARPKQARRAK
jgi:predicted enzyme related to lactoylglutathione lyase